MYTSLKGKTAIVTGASRGIGRGIALALASEGVNLVLNATKAASLEEVRMEVEALGVSFACVAGDMADPETARRLAALAMEKHGRIDILVNNAGIQNRKKVAELSLEEWDRMIAVNESGVFYMCKAVLPFMTEAKQGSIINITSTASKTPQRGHLLWSVKGGGHLSHKAPRHGTRAAGYPGQCRAVRPHPLRYDRPVDGRISRRRNEKDSARQIGNPGGRGGRRRVPRLGRGVVDHRMQP